MNDDLVTWLRQQMENQRHTGDALKALAAALPPETGAYLTEVGDFLIADASAKRRIVDEMEVIRVRSTAWQALDQDVAEAIDRMAGALSLPYADRPGYRNEWKP